MKKALEVVSGLGLAGAGVLMMPVNAPVGILLFLSGGAELAKIVDEKK